MSYKFFAYIFFLAVIIGGCASALYMPTSSQVTENATLEELNNGRASYVNKCGGCHTLKLPSEYSAHVWQENLDEMQERARISDKEKSDIFKYLRADAKKDSETLNH